MECIDEKREGIATEHAATTGSDLPGGTATERASGTCTDLGLLTDVDMTSGGDRKTYPILEVAHQTKAICGGPCLPAFRNPSMTNMLSAGMSSIHGIG